MAEEELDINSTGGAPAPTGSSGDGPVNKIEVAVGGLSDMARPGETNESSSPGCSPRRKRKLIPWEECWLPSRGLWYPGWKGGAGDGGLIKVKAMGQTAEKILATQRLAQTGQSIDYLFRECCRFPVEGFDPTEMLLGDRTFLLYFLRGITHGNMYEFAITCPNRDCGAVSTHQYDLMELADTTTWGNPNLGTEPFKIVLPYMSQAAQREVWVGVRFLRGADANAILAQRNARNKFIRPGQVKTRLKGRGVDPRQQQQQTQVLDDSLSSNMERIIVSVMGVQDPLMVRDFVQKLHAQDTATIREWLRENTPGIDNTVTVTCPDCKTEFTAELPITDSFFRPSKRR
jgi:hypothetical protein